MKGAIVLFLILILVPSVFAVSSPVNYNGKTYYTVTSTDPTEDTGDEVCTKLGMTCKGYTEPTSAVCKLFHPGAAETSSLSGDESGVYCDGAPQGGVCGSQTNTCHTCPACTVSVQCNQPIGGLYREMYVECEASSCKVKINAVDVADFMNQLPSLDAQFKGCPQTIPKGMGFVLGNGITQVHINMNSGATQSFYLDIRKGEVIGAKAGTMSCTQTLTIAEDDFNSILTSSDVPSTISYLYSQKKIQISGCTFFSSLRLFFVKPIIKFVAPKVPTPPPPTPPPNCGNVGEQCNNRGCFSGICAAPEENIGGSWGHYNYRCLALSDWDTYCQGRGNTPPPWACLTGPCG